MQDSMGEILKTWQNFYMLAGGASAGLIGLVFVAASLAARLVDPETAEAGVRTFVTPIIVHFSAVVVAAMLVMVPGQTAATFGGLACAGGALGLCHAAATGVRIGRHHRGRSRVSRADWVWRAWLPGAAYLMILGGAALGLLTRADASLTGLAYAVIVLLLLGVRNAWDLFLWVSKHHPAP